MRHLLSAVLGLSLLGVAGCEVERRDRGVYDDDFRQERTLGVERDPAFRDDRMRDEEFPQRRLGDDPDRIELDRGVRTGEPLHDDPMRDEPDLRTDDPAHDEAMRRDRELRERERQREPVFDD